MFPWRLGLWALWVGGGPEQQLLVGPRAGHQLGQGRPQRPGPVGGRAVVPFLNPPFCKKLLLYDRGWERREANLP